MDYKSENTIYAGIGIITIGLFSLIFLGVTGFRTIMGFILLFFPFYLILDSFSLKESEKIIYSIILGFIFVSSLSYWLGFIISFKVAIFVVFIVMLAIGILLKKFRKSGIKYSDIEGEVSAARAK